MPLLWDSLKHLAAAVNHLCPATDILDEIVPNAADYPTISQLLEAQEGITSWKFQDCCRALERSERCKAVEWDALYL